MPANITVVCDNEEFKEIARNFSSTHGLPACSQLPVNTPLYLDLNESLPRLCDGETKTCIKIDFTSGSLAHRLKFGGGQGQALAKAVGISSANKPHILDATAGLGRDALVLANLGCRLTLVEQSPVLYQMLIAAKNMAADNPVFQQATVAGFDIYHADAKEFMKQWILSEADVVYLDPMYPENKKSALVKKEMQHLQKLLGHSTDDQLADLLATALDFAKQRVVVKRPKSARPLKGPAPTLSIASKKTRYDIYVIRALNKST